MESNPGEDKEGQSCEMRINPKINSGKVNAGLRAQDERSKNTRQGSSISSKSSTDSLKVQSEEDKVLSGSNLEEKEKEDFTRAKN